MKECPACRELFDGSDVCPRCGCPTVGLVSWEETALPRQLKGRYNLLREWGEMGQGKYLLKNVDGSQYCIVQTIPPGEAGEDFIGKLEKIRKGGYAFLPAFYELVSDPSGERCCLYECREELSLQDIVERENPVGKEAFEVMRSQLYALLERLDRAGICHGQISLASLGLSGNGVVLKDYGCAAGRMENAKPDRERMEEILKRLSTGEWQSGEGAAAPSGLKRFWTKLFTRPGNEEEAEDQ